MHRRRPSSPARPILEVQVIEVTHQTVPDEPEFIGQAKVSLDAAKGDVVKARFDLDDTLITAPIDGLIERTRYDEGRLVTAHPGIYKLTGLITFVDGFQRAMPGAQVKPVKTTAPATVRSEGKP